MGNSRGLDAAESPGHDPGASATAVRDDDRRQSILLVGFMASGKSEVARILTGRLGWPSLDVDELVEAEAGMSVREIFDRRGEPWFRRREAALTSRLLDRRGVIVAPGGGWAGVPGRVSAAPEHVLSVWLRVSAQEAVRRGLGTPGSRPLMTGGEASTAEGSPGQRAGRPAETPGARSVPADGTAGTVARMEALLRHREAGYREARLHLDTENGPPEEMAERILHHLARR
ncbi:MAG: shikimate kinase [Gemmatimonadota bacterium]